MLEAIVFFAALAISIFSVYGFIIYIKRLDHPEKKFDFKTIRKYNITMWIACILWAVLYYLAHQ